MIHFLCSLVRRCPGVRTALLFSLTVTAVAADALPGVDGKWRRLESAHFELYSRTNEADSRAVLHHLELVRACAMQVLGLRERMPRAVTVYYFSGERSLRAYFPEGDGKKEWSSNFAAFVDRDIMTLSASLDQDLALEMVQHSYLNQLLQVQGRPVPLWLRIGAGFLFSTLEPRTKEMEFGRADAYRVQTLEKAGRFDLTRLLSTQQLLRGQKEADEFHAHAWGFMHYLYLGQKEIAREKVDAFIARALSGGRAGEGPALLAAMEEVLGVAPAELERRVQRYLRSGRFPTQRLPRPDVPAAGSYAMRAVPAAEIRLRLAELALRVRRAPEARVELLSAAGQPGPDARVFEALGVDAWLEGDLDRAMDRWQRAIDAGSDNAAIYHQVGLHLCSRWFRRIDVYFRLTPELADQLRHLLAASITRAPNQSSAYEGLAWVEATAPKPLLANVNLVQSRFAELDNQTSTLLALALVRVRLEQFEDAGRLLDRVEAEDDNPGIQAAVKALRALIARPPAAGGP